MNNILEFNGRYKAVISYAPELYAHVTAYAKAKNMSINSFITDTLKKQLANEM